MSRLSTHVLDTSLGQPAVGVEVSLEFAEHGGWKPIGQGRTDADGRIGNILDRTVNLVAGDYRLRFATAAYFEALALPIFYPEVQVHLRLDGSKNAYHLPLLLSPYGYSTYRGS
jgi:5-hydroxyisourate hydrolase